MNSLLSIGQFAKLCNTTKDTLIHYDDIGLFHPYQTGENQYRLYSTSQCQMFHLIRILVEHNMPLLEIKKLFENNSADTLMESLTLKRNELLYRKQYLESAILHLDDLLQLQSIATSNQSDEPFMINQESPQDFFVTAVPTPNTTSKHISQSLTKHFADCYKNGLYPFPITYIIKKESLAARNYIPYLIATPVASTCINYTYRKPEINYVVISHSGSYDTIHHTIEKALAYIKRRQLQILGNFYISDFSNCIPSASSMQYIIQIAVKEC